jgi:hypothetical protein
MSKNPHAVTLGRKGGLARKGKPGRKLTSEEAKRIRKLRKRTAKKEASNESK